MEAQTPTGRCDGFLTLPFAEQFLVWAARIWLASAARGEWTPTVLQEGLCAGGVPEAWEPLDGLLRILCRNMRRIPDFHGVRCLCVGRDERVLIRALAAAQRGDAATARYALESLLPAMAIPAAAIRLEELGHLFLCAGLRFDRVSGHAARTAGTPIHGPASRSIH